ncbi:hypothetical protein [Marinobacter sp.]|uniref:hypothetical protein n=1 Tax=Marinobacter sp. TaxID=50741 RepID=UPI003BAA6187
MDSVYPDIFIYELKKLLRFLGQIFLPFFYGFLTKVRASLAPQICCPEWVQPKVLAGESPCWATFIVT